MTSQTAATRRLLLGTLLGVLVLALLGRPPSASALTIDCNQSGIGCISQFGYTGASVWGYPVDGAGNNCTNYVAFRLARNGAANPGNLGDAFEWAGNARAKGFTVNTTPAVGAIAFFSSSHPWAPGSGHVAYVDAVSGATVSLSDSNWERGSKRWRVSRGEASYPTEFIHIKDVNTPAPPPLPPPAPAAGSPFGNLELVKGVNGGYVAVRGWTMDPNAKSTPTRVHVYVEDSNLGSAIANIDRPDVERVHGGGRAHGFSAAFKLAPGRHTVRVYAINVPDTPGSNPMLDSITITVPEPVAGAPFGNFESAEGLLGGRAEVIGWTVDPNARNGSTGVHAYIDGPSGSGFRLADLGIANRVRNDVARVHDGRGLHGFRSTISGLTPGWHSIWIYGLNVSGTPGNNPLIDVAKVNVPPGDAPPAVVTPPTPGTQTPPVTTGSGGTPGTTGGTGTTGTTGGNGTTTKPARCRVPRLAGKTVPNARKGIVRSGCRLGKITYVGRANRRADRVVKSSRKAGVSLPARAKVNLLVRR
ncbi:CHAP domain-containing protein [Miltoncostaea oceani]|uniref:CHAP domain-containing protein n=1 Tax=Miltoncostaea oceani TaxID=2843216 RepID=UPI001C3D5C93|nr:CHAP domain-containing protein [Miltoncostaea oceani]